MMQKKSKHPMRIDTQKKLRSLLGENVVITGSGSTTDMTRVVSLNDTALDLYNALKDRDFELDDVVQVLTDTYAVDAATARRDAEKWIGEMRDNHLLL